VIQSQAQANYTTKIKPRLVTCSPLLTCRQANTRGQVPEKTKPIGDRTGLSPQQVPLCMLNSQGLSLWQSLSALCMQIAHFFTNSFPLEQLTNLCFIMITIWVGFLFRGVQSYIEHWRCNSVSICFTVWLVSVYLICTADLAQKLQNSFPTSLLVRLSGNSWLTICQSVHQQCANKLLIQVDGKVKWRNKITRQLKDRIA